MIEILEMQNFIELDNRHVFLAMQKVFTYPFCYTLISIIIPTAAGAYPDTVGPVLRPVATG